MDPRKLKRSSSERGKKGKDEDCSFSENESLDAQNSPCQSLQGLKEAQEEFELFLVAVSDDTVSKIEQLKKIKSADSLYWNDKSYANIQILMLNQYCHRINRFKEVSRNSLHCVKNKPVEKSEQAARKHIETLSKLKRRLKHILDVSNKYAVEEMFDTLNILNDMPEDLGFDLKHGTVRKKSVRRHNSLITIQKNMLFPTSEGSKKDEDETKKHRGRTLRSLSDHLSVLTKTYTNRR